MFSAPSEASKPERRIKPSGCGLTLASTSAIWLRCSASMPEVSIMIRRCIASTTQRVPAGNCAGTASTLPTAPKNSEPNSQYTLTPGGSQWPECHQKTAR